jgi:hypothetical protein
MKIKFRDIRMSKANLERLQRINSIIAEYQRAGYVMTLRQLYYQLVSRGVIPNVQSEYSKLSTLLKEGRMAGIVDWSAIEDRLRKPSSPASFNSPSDILDAAISQFQLPRQKGQSNYVELWIEKDALSGVLSRVTRKYHIPIVVNRGYSSASAMFDAFERFKDAHENNQEIKILYLGDFDPSGLDMIRDIRDRTIEFLGGFYEIEDREEIIESFGFEVLPIALTRAQITKYDPPENPAKRTDPRSRDFIAEHGYSSWEVDALPPDVLNKVLEDAIIDLIDLDMYDAQLRREKKGIKNLKALKTYLPDGDEEE